MKKVPGIHTGKRSKREVFPTQESSEKALYFNGLQLGDVCEVKYTFEHFQEVKTDVPHLRSSPC
jgi:hypothetical protein